MKMLRLSLPKSITSDNHLTGAVHTGHVIPASTCSGSLLSMILVTLPITDIYHRVNSFPSLYISLLTLATCRNYSPMKAALLQSSCSVASHMGCMLSSALHRKNPLMIATYPHIWFDVLCVDSEGIAPIIFKSIWPLIHASIIKLLLPSNGKLLHIYGKLRRMPDSDRVHVCCIPLHMLRRLLRKVRKFQR